MNILAVYAHPDDAEFLASGSMAKWAEEGHQVYAISATDGSMGTKIVGRTRAEVAERRRGELTRAMEVIGGHEPVGFWFPDGSLRSHDEELKEKLAFWVRKLRADRIVTLDPWLSYEIHPDHITVGRIASEVAVFTCFPLYFPEQIEAGKWTGPGLTCLQVSEDGTTVTETGSTCDNGLSFSSHVTGQDGNGNSCTLNAECEGNWQVEDGKFNCNFEGNEGATQVVGYFTSATTATGTAASAGFGLFGSDVCSGTWTATPE